MSTTNPRMAWRATVLALWVLISILPIIWIILTSVKPSALVASIPPAFVFKPTGENYLGLFEKYNFVRYFVNSVVVTAAVVVVSLAAGALAGYSLARFRTGGRVAVFAFMAAQMVPPMVITFPLFILFQAIGLIDTRIGLVLADLTFVLPFTTWVMRQFFLGVPLEIEEAALVDGASRYRALLSVVLPIARPGLTTALIFALIFTWNEFVYALTLTVQKAQTVTIAASNFITTYAVLWGKIDAVATIIIVVPALVVLLMRRYIVSGLVGSAVKG